MVFKLRGLGFLAMVAVGVGFGSACADEEKDPFTAAGSAGTGAGAGGTGGASGGKGGSAGNVANAGKAGAGGGNTGGGNTGGNATGGSTGGSDPAGGEGGMVIVDPPETCTGDADCQPAGMVCDPVPQECVACLFDIDCEPGEKCVDRSCQPVATCNNSLDCTGTTETVCDASIGECVGCVTVDDCEASSDCIDNTCVPYDQCRNSLDCSNRRVCDTNTQRCVECARDADCGTGRRCVDFTCREGCASDNACTALGMLCNTNGGYCVQCLEDLDCPSVYYCNAGTCTLDECPAGTSECVSNAVNLCRASGNGYDATSCLSRETCVEEGIAAACMPWVCTAGVTECDVAHDSLVTCSADGLTITDEVDCTANGEICYSGTCQDLECVPSLNYCDGETIRLCSSDGLSSTLVQTCGSGQFCDDTTVSCLTQICTPDQPWCNGALAQVCNSRGSGSTGPGTNCAGISGHECVAGECVCQANRLDCDNDEGNGCEVNSSTDVDNCGACDNACSSNHVPTPSCSASTCNGACQAGYTDCNADKRTDGCETHTDTDVANCGACGRTCSSSQVASVTCAGGVCNGTCTSGYADCNSNKQTDGCETDTLTNPNSCGGCTNNCSSNHVQTRTCSGGSCNGTCATGYDDCNNDKLTDGCESDVRYDEANCGACGNDCAAGESCVQGTCQVCNDTVLVLSDAQTTSNTQITTALTNAGLVPTMVSNGAVTYAGTPAASDFGAVLFMVGNTLSSTVDDTGEAAIVAAQAAGTGLVFGGSVTYKEGNYSTYMTTAFKALLLTTYSSYTQTTGSYTLTSAGHPIWDTLPTTFSTTVTQYHNYGGSVKNGGVSIASCSFCSVTPSVTVRESPGGRIVHFAHWMNYTSTFYTDTNVMTMLVNGAKWATGCF